MGSAKSILATPARPAPCNKHLTHVTDPRSPSAGILRTPIQITREETKKVGATPDMEQPQGSDPRSPTFGIIQTPMKTSTIDPANQLVKQLSEAFGAEASKLEHSSELALPVKFSSQPEPDLSLDTPLSLKHKKLPTSLTSSTSNDQPDKFLRGSETPCSSGSRPSRRKRAGKVLGRSPLTTLQDDNSPGLLMPRQSKQSTVLSENVGERKEGAILRTGHPLKIT
uniref:Cell division cycle associated 3 n=1 Tax=Vombatus ursinus TaxID=29139 RepID=A0A4X2K4A6_VOMUR